MAYGATLTLPTITGSHSDFPVLLKTADFPAAAIDGTANAIDNGGGDLRAYTSSAKTTQLPIDVVAFVSSGTPSAEVYVKVPTAATGNTIYIEKDDVATTQPAVTDTYGRNAVWADYKVVGHLIEAANNTTEGYVNSTGGTGGTGTSMSLSNIAGPMVSPVAQFDGTNDKIIFPVSFAATDDTITYQIWARTDDLTVDQRAVSLWNANLDYSVAVIWMDTDGGGDGWLAQAKNASGSAYTCGDATDNDAVASTWILLHHRYGTSNSELYKDGASAKTASGSGNLSDGTGDINKFVIGNLWGLTGSGAHFAGGQAEARLRIGELSDDWVATEGSNLTSATAWVSVGSWAAGGGAVLSGDAINNAVAVGSLTTDITLTGASTVVATATGALSVPIDLAGAAAVISISGGDLTAQITLSGAATAQAIANAGLDTSILFGGDASSSASASGDLTTGSGLSGDAASQAQATGSITTQIQLSASAVAQALATGDLSVPTSGLSGDAASTSGASGILSTDIPLAGDATATVTGAGDLHTQIKLDGVALNIVSGTGSLTASITLSGNAAALVAAGADLTTEIPLSVDALSQALATGFLTSGDVVTIKNPKYTVAAKARDYNATDARSYRVAA